MAVHKKCSPNSNTSSDLVDDSSAVSPMNMGTIPAISVFGSTDAVEMVNSIEADQNQQNTLVNVFSIILYELHNEET